MMEYRVVLALACVAWCLVACASASSCHYIKSVARKLGVDLRTIWDAESYPNGNSINLGQDDSLSSASAHSDGLDLGSPLSAHTVLLLSNPGVRAQQEAPLYSLLTCYSADETCGESTEHDLASSTEQPDCHVLQCETYLPLEADAYQASEQHLRGEVSAAFSWGASMPGFRASFTSLTDDFLSESARADVVFIDLENLEIFLESGSTAKVSAYVKHICDGTVLLLDASVGHGAAAVDTEQPSPKMKNLVNHVADSSLAFRTLKTVTVTDSHVTFSHLHGGVFDDIENHHRHLSEFTSAPVFNGTQSSGVTPAVTGTQSGGVTPAVNGTQFGGVTPPAGVTAPPGAATQSPVGSGNATAASVPAANTTSGVGVVPLNQGPPAWDWQPGTNGNDSEQSGSTFGMTEVEERDLSDEETGSEDNTVIANVVLALASTVTALLFIGAVYTGLLYRRKFKEHQLAMYAEQQNGEHSEFTIHDNNLHRQHVMVTNSAAAYVSGTGDGSETALPGEEVIKQDEPENAPLPSMTRWA